jgi:hypothetical protein
METISKPCGGVEDCLSMFHLALSLLKKILKILSFLLLGFIHTLPFGAVNCWFLTSLHLTISSGFGPPIAGNGLPMQLPKIQILHVPYSSMPHTCQSMQTFLPKFRDCSSQSSPRSDAQQNSTSIILCSYPTT